MSKNIEYSHANFDEKKPETNTLFQSPSTLAPEKKTNEEINRIVSANMIIGEQSQQTLSLINIIDTYSAENEELQKKVSDYENEGNVKLIRMIIFLLLILVLLVLIFYLITKNKN